jgi:hypothetical protein
MMGGLLDRAKASEAYGDSVLMTLPIDMKNLPYSNISLSHRPGKSWNFGIDIPKSRT